MFNAIDEIEIEIEMGVEIGIEIEIERLKESSSLSLNFTDRPEERCIHIDLMHCPSIGGDLGTKVMKCLVQLSEEKGYGGRVDTEAAYSSHFFYLYMGMIPFEREIDYVFWNYGSIGTGSLKKLAECETEIDLAKMSEIEIGSLTFMLSTETSFKKDDITPLMLVENKELLLNLNNKKFSSLPESFIRGVLRAIKFNLGEQYPNTSSLGAIRMTLSAEGKERWLNAIKSDTPFESFKNFEHLRPYMTTEQIVELDNLLLKNRLAMNSVEKTSPADTSSEAASSQATHLVQTEHTLSTEEKQLKISESGLILFRKIEDVNKTAPNEKSFCLIS